MDGGSHIRRVEILTAAGERTEIRFQNVRVGGAITPEERRFFE
jgi:hypothetical protein